MANERDAQREVLKGHCPNCGPERLSDVWGEYSHEENDEYIRATIFYRLLVCRGCLTPYFQSEELVSELNVEGDWNPYLPSAPTHYPPPIRRVRPAWLRKFEGERLLAELGIEKHGELWQLLHDVYGCLDANLVIPAAISVRTTFDKATEILGINAETFQKKLNALHKNDKISQDEYDTLEVLVDAGSASAHRGWKPQPADLDTLVSLLESFLHRTFVLGEAARQLKESVPKRSRSPKAR